tara:strand:+ start:392 stop:742 length:351 start_codon:yes stop_codon:yes gene_type:complete
MERKSFIFSDLSNKQLEKLKDLYIKKKVQSMSHEELQKFVTEIIAHQINDTIGKEEEMEAWREMSDYFGEQFESVILEIQKEFKDDNLKPESDSPMYRQALIEKNNISQEKKDMWD